MIKVSGGFFDLNNRLPRAPVDLRTWAAVTEACAGATLAVYPYVHAMLGAMPARDANRRRPPTGLALAGLLLVQGHLNFGLISGLGLRAAGTMGLGLPHLEAGLRGRPMELRPGQVGRYAAAGGSAAVLVGLLDSTVFAGARDSVTAGMAKPPAAWQGLLASTYGAIAEEVLMRLGLQTLIAAVLRRVRHESTNPPSGAVMWPAIAVSNLLFGAGHLPTTARMTRLTAPVIARSLALNGLVGAVCGYLYWKRRSLEAAMIAHGAADIVLHVLGPLFTRRR